MLVLLHHRTMTLQLLFHLETVFFLDFEFRFPDLLSFCSSNSKTSSFFSSSPLGLYAAPTSVIGFMFPFTMYVFPPSSSGLKSRFSSSLTSFGDMNPFCIPMLYPLVLLGYFPRSKP